MIMPLVGLLVVVVMSVIDFCSGTIALLLRELIVLKLMENAMKLC